MKRSIVLGFLFGAALFTALIVWFGVADILAVLVVVGWSVVLVSAFRFSLLVFDMLSWRALLRGADRKSLGQLFWIRWVADSVNTLLPVARIGGEFLRAHMLYRRGVTGAVAGASVMADVTAGIFTQLVFSVVGVAVFASVVGGGANTTRNLTLGLALFGIGLAGFYAIQRSGLFARMARLAEATMRGRDWRNLTGNAADFDAALAAVYRDRRAVTACCFWRIAGWIAGTAEVWLILFFLGHPVTLAEAFILESLGQAARSAGFMIPGGLGVQEGGLLLVGGQLGLTPELALGLSLVKRGRELLIGVPGLIAWQIVEGRGFWTRRE